MLTLLIVGVINPAFLAPGNLRDVLVASAPTVIVACGLTFVVVLGEIDISMGALLGLLATVMGQLTSPTHAGLPVAVGIALTLAVGVGVGLVNGLLVAYGRMPSIIVTLGMLTVLQGVNLTLINGRFITDLPPGLRFFGIGRVLGVPVSVVVAVAAVAVSDLSGRPDAAGPTPVRGGEQPGRGPAGRAERARPEAVRVRADRPADGRGRPRQPCPAWASSSPASGRALSCWS